MGRFVAAADSGADGAALAVADHRGGDAAHEDEVGLVDAVRDAAGNGVRRGVVADARRPGVGAQVDGHVVGRRERRPRGYLDGEVRDLVVWPVLARLPCEGAAGAGGHLAVDVADKCLDGFGRDCRAVRDELSRDNGVLVEVERHDRGAGRGLVQHDVGDLRSPRICEESDGEAEKTREKQGCFHAGWPPSGR